MDLYIKYKFSSLIPSCFFTHTHTIFSHNLLKNNIILLKERGLKKAIMAAISQLECPNGMYHFVVSH